MYILSPRPFLIHTKNTRNEQLSKSRYGKYKNLLANSIWQQRYIRLKYSKLVMKYIWRGPKSQILRLFKKNCYIYIYILQARMNTERLNDIFLSENRKSLWYTFCFRVSRLEKLFPIDQKFRKVYCLYFANIFFILTSPYCR